MSDTSETPRIYTILEDLTQEEKDNHVLKLTVVFDYDDDTPEIVTMNLPKVPFTNDVIDEELKKYPYLIHVTGVIDPQKV